MATQHSLAAGIYRTRPQPDRDEVDPNVLHDHIGVLRTELRQVAGGRAQVHMRTETDPAVLHGQIEQLNELLAEAYIKRAGVPAAAHSTDCAVNQVPVFRPGPCDCGAGRP